MRVRSAAPVGARGGGVRGAVLSTAGLLTVVLLAVLSVLWPARAARAQTDGQEITRYVADIEVGADGVADVRVELDFDFDFGDEPGHGPFLTLPTRQAIEGDDRFDRLFRITDISASSDTAPDDLDVETTRHGVVLRIGDEDEDDVQGVHTYVVQYRAEGWINPAGARGVGSGTATRGDELYLDVLGADWEIPLADITATVTGPADVLQTACFAGPRGNDTPCTEAPGEHAASTVTFRQDEVDAGEPFTVVVSWPTGTFPGVEPMLGEKIDLLDPVRPNPVTGAAALLVAGVGGAFAVRAARRERRERAALGLPAGMVSGGDPAFRDHRPPVAVQSTPPAGVRPGELGTLLDEVADPRDVTATIVDLAVRGHLHIREVPPEGVDAGSGDGDGSGGVAGDWELVLGDRGPVAGDPGLLPFEQRLLDDLFEGRSSVRMSEVKTTFSGSMAKVQELLYQHVTANGWFRANPKTVRTHWYLTGSALLLAGVIVSAVAFAALVAGLALVGVALAVVGILVLVLARSAPARTAAGTEVLTQAVAFKRYLETADADLLRMVHGDDLFSRYLPYAIVFGLTERWSGVFGDLAGRGERVPEPTWYSGYGAAPYLYWGAASGFGHSVDSFAEVTTESISAATPATSGSSGFSGGFSGGGVGGGGGGGW